MIATPAYFDVFTLLADNSFGRKGETLFGGQWGQVDCSDAQTLVLEGAGVPSELKQDYEQPGIQILVRGAKSGQPDRADIDVYAKAKAIYDFLVEQEDSILINEVCYTGFEPSTNLAALGKDENERFIYSMNFTTYRNQS